MAEVQHQPNQFELRPENMSGMGPGQMQLMSMLASMLLAKSGQQENPRFIPPYTPGLSQMQMAMATRLSPKRQELMQEMNQHVQPITSMFLDAASNYGYKDMSNSLRGVMGRNPFLTQFAAYANNSPFMDQLMGGNIFRGHEQLLTRAGNFTRGVFAPAPQQALNRSMGAMDYTNYLGAALLNKTYGVEGQPGKFNLAGNYSFSRGWQAEQTQQLLAEGAGQGMYQLMGNQRTGKMGVAYMSDVPLIDPGTGRLVNPADASDYANRALAMTARLNEATAQVSSATGITDPVQALNYLRSAAGPGSQNRDITHLTRVANSMGRVSAAAIGVYGVRGDLAVQGAGAVAGAVNDRLSLMADPSGQTRVGGALGIAMGESASYAASREAGMTGAKSPEAYAALMDKYGRQQLRRFDSKMGRQTLLATHLIATNPAAAAFKGALETAVTRGETGKVQKIIEEMSDTVYGDSKTIARSAADNAVFEDAVYSFEEKERTMNRDPLDISREWVKLTNTGEKAELHRRGKKLYNESERDRYRRLDRRLGLSVNRNDMAKSQIAQMMNVLKEAVDMGEVSPTAMKDLKQRMGSGSAEDRLSRLNSVINSDPTYEGVKERLDSASAKGEGEYYKGVAVKYDPAKGYSEKWTDYAMDSLRSLPGTNPKSREALNKRIREINRIADPAAKGKALSDFIRSDEYLKLGGTKVTRAHAMEALVAARQSDRVLAAAARDSQTDLAPDKKFQQQGPARNQGATAGALEANDQAALEKTSGVFIGQEQSDREKASKRGTIIQNLALAASEGNFSDFGKTILRAFGVDTDQIDAFQQQADDVSGRGGKGGGGRNTVQEVVLKEGTTIFIVEPNGTVRTGKTTTRSGK